jgi:hypothetical protein
MPAEELTNHIASKRKGNTTIILSPSLIERTRND